MDMKHAGHGGYAGRRRIFRRARAGIPEKYRRLGLACMLCLLAARDFGILWGPLVGSEMCIRDSAGGETGCGLGALFGDL